jgi:hypothetical protein
MSVTQLSKIQVRRGKLENLPQLSAGELGWAIDTQQLFIGNGSFEEGAASEGNTEILTELSGTGVGFSTATLVDNTSSATEFYRFNLTSYPAGIIRYSIVRNGVYRSGITYYANGGSGVITISDAGTGSVGVTITAAHSGDNAIFSYVTTSTGYDATMRFQRVDHF